MTETDQQKAVIAWANDAAKYQPKKYWMLDFLFAVPNEGKHKIQYRMHQKAMGLKAGVPDLVLPYPKKKIINISPEYHALFIEMKSRDTKGSVSKHQKKWIAYLSEQGYKVEVCWSADEAIKAIETYIFGK